MCGQLWEYITEKALGMLVLQLQDIQVRQIADGILCEQERVVHLYLRNSTKFTFGNSLATFTLPPGFSLPLTRTFFVDSGM